MLCWGTSTVKKLSILAVYNLTYIYVRLDRVIKYSSTLPWLRVDLVTFPLRHLASEVGASQNRSNWLKSDFARKNTVIERWFTKAKFYSQGGNVHYTFHQISRSLAILPMVDPPPPGYHCWNSHFVPCWISGTLAILPTVDPPFPTPAYSPYIRKRPRHESQFVSSLRPEWTCFS